MRVMLVYPNDRMDNLISAGVSSLAGHLKAGGHQVELYDTTFYDTGRKIGDYYREKVGQIIPIDLQKQGVERHKISLNELQGDFRKSVLDYNPGLIGFSVLEMTFNQGLQLARSIQDIRIPKIFGGIYPTFAPRIVLREPSIDMVCEGEGDEMLTELATALERGYDIIPILNLTVKKDGKIYRSGECVKLEDLPTGDDVDGNSTGLRRPLINLENLAAPDYSIYDDDRFFKKMGGEVARTVAMELSRGCPYTCSFCCSYMMQQQHKVSREKYSKQSGLELELLKKINRYHREKPIDKFVTEAKEAIEQYGITYIYFTDESFLSMSEERFKEFVEKYKQINLPFFLEIRPETVREGYAKILESINCSGVAMGIESGNPEIRKNLLRRYLTNQQIIKSFKEFAPTKIRVSANNIIGFPGETREDIMQTIELNRQIYAEGIIVNGFRPSTGTELRKVCIERGLIPKEVITKDMRVDNSFFNGVLTAAELSGLRRVFNFYVKFPKDRWDEIRKAETDDDLFESLKQEYKEKRMLWKKG